MMVPLVLLEELGHFLPAELDYNLAEIDYNFVELDYKLVELGYNLPCYSDLEHFAFVAMTCVVVVGNRTYYLEVAKGLPVPYWLPTEEGVYLSSTEEVVLVLKLVFWLTVVVVELEEMVQLEAAGQRIVLVTFLADTLRLRFLVLLLVILPVEEGALPLGQGVYFSY